MALLPAGAAVLELGCGGGQDSAAMLAQGFAVTPTDGSPQMAHEAQALLGRPVRVLAFAHLDDQASYDGIWANACLLHVPHAELAGIIARIWRALKDGGVFHASFKAGDAGGRDRFGRYYNYPTQDFLRDAYQQSRWQSLEIACRPGGTGYAGDPADWLHVSARKAG